MNILEELKTTEKISLHEYRDGDLIILHVPPNYTRNNLDRAAMCDAVREQLKSPHVKVMVLSSDISLSIFRKATV